MPQLLDPRQRNLTTTNGANPRALQNHLAPRKGKLRRCRPPVVRSPVGLMAPLRTRRLLGLLGKDLPHHQQPALLDQPEERLLCRQHSGNHRQHQLPQGLPRHPLRFRLPPDPPLWSPPHRRLLLRLVDRFVWHDHSRPAKEPPLLFPQKFNTRRDISTLTVHPAGAMNVLPRTVVLGVSAARCSAAGAAGADGAVVGAADCPNKGPERRRSNPPMPSWEHDIAGRKWRGRREKRRRTRRCRSKSRRLRGRGFGCPCFCPCRAAVCSDEWQRPTRRSMDKERLLSYMRKQ